MIRESEMREKCDEVKILILLGLAIFGLVGFFGSPPATAATETSDWTRIETNHFTIFSQAGHDVGRQVGGDLERLHHFLEVLTGGPGAESPLPTYFYIFRDEASMAPFRQAVSYVRPGPQFMSDVSGGAPNAGYLVPHEHGSYAVVAGGEGFVPTRYIFKQYIHHRLHQEIPYLPDWFKHGVAEYYSAFETDGDVALLGLPSEEHLYWIRHRSGGLLPARELMQMGEADLAAGSDRQRTFFRQSWALFHYLLNREGANRQQPARFIAELAAGAASIPAFERAYGVNLETLTQELEAYLGRGSLTYLKIPVKKLDLLILKFTDLESYEAEYHLGDLLARAVEDGAYQAERHFLAALSANPRFAPAWAGLGYLAESAGDLETASRHYEKAASGDPDDFLTAYLYGKSLLRSLDGRRPADAEQEQVLERAIDALGRSVELRDRFGEAWAELGYAHGLQAEASDAGVEALRRALDFFPDRADLALNLLLAHARRGERAPADAVFSDLVETGADAGTLGRAREILLQMDYRDAARMVSRGQAEEAIALFARIQAETKNEALRETIEQQLEKLSIVGDYRDFFELYNQAAEAINSGQKERAQELVDRLAQGALEPWQLGQVKRLKRGLAQL